MRVHVIRILVAINVLLALALALLWFDLHGNLRNVRWTPPAPISPDFSKMVPALSRQAVADTGRFVAALDRPLFSPTRRPPPPVVVAAVVAPPPDPLANIQLLGLFVGAQSGGIVARIDGKNRRLRLSETVGEWTLKSIVERDVTFARGEETRVLRLERVRPAVPAAVAAAPADSGASPTAPEGQPAPAGATMAQRLEEENRERLRRRNAIRSQAGLPPVTQ